MQDVQLLVNTLVYDGRLEEVSVGLCTFLPVINNGVGYLLGGAMLSICNVTLVCNLQLSF